MYAYYIHLGIVIIILALVTTLNEILITSEIGTQHLHRFCKSKTLAPLRFSAVMNRINVMWVEIDVDAEV